MAPLINAPAPNVPYYVPRQYPPAGTAFDPQPDGKPLPSLFQPIKIRGVEFQNRIWVRPLLAPRRPRILDFIMVYTHILTTCAALASLPILL